MNEPGKPFEPRIVWEPCRDIRAAARMAIRGRWGVLYFSSLALIMCVGAPLIIVEQISVTWEKRFEGLSELMRLSMDAQVQAEAQARAAQGAAGLFELSPEFQKAAEGWSEAYGDTLFPSAISWLFVLLAGGALMFGASRIWAWMLAGRTALGAPENARNAVAAIVPAIDPYTTFEKMFGGHAPTAGDALSGFEHFPRATLLFVLQSVMTAIWSIIFVIPGVIAHYRYSCGFFLLTENPRLNPALAVFFSTMLMRGNKLKRFLLDLSFIGWCAAAAVAAFAIANACAAFVPENAPYAPALLALCALVGIAIPFAWVLGYHGVATAEFYRLCTQTIRDAGLITERPA